MRRNEASTLNYTLEYLAGTLDDNQTRFAALSAFGLSSLDPVELQNLNFVRSFASSDPSNATGLLGAISHNGQLPFLMRAIKTDTDATIVATPFILANDNRTSTINVETDMFFEENTFTADGQFTSAGLGTQSAGITLSLTPTISQNVVLLDLSLTVSSFGNATDGAAFPDRNRNEVTSLVSIASGDLFIIGGLARENRSLAVTKIPILGDLPLLGRLFQSRGSDRRRDNLYVFLTAHILEGKQLEDLSEQAVDSMSAFGEDIRIQKFSSPRDAAPRKATDDDEKSSELDQ